MEEDDCVSGPLFPLSQLSGIASILCGQQRPVRNATHPIANLLFTTVDGKTNPPNRANKGINKDIKYFFLIRSVNIRVLYNRCLVFPGVLEGLGSSGRLIGTFSTYPGT